MNYSETNVFRAFMSSHLTAALLVLVGLFSFSTVNFAAERISHNFNFDSNQNIQGISGKPPAKLIGAKIRSNGGKTKGGLQLTNNSHVLTMPGINLNGMQTFSIAAWVKPSNFSGHAAEGRLISKTLGSNEAEHYWMLGLTGDGTAIRFRLKTSVHGVSTLSTLNGQIARGKWSHIAAVYTGKKMEIYVNGTLAASKRKTGRVVDLNTLSAAIGNQLPDQEQRAFVGTIDDLVIYSKAVTGEFLKNVAGSEIKVVATAEVKPTVEPNLQTKPIEIVAYGDLIIPAGRGVSVRWGPNLTLIGADNKGDKASVFFGWRGYSVSTSRNRYLVDYDGAAQSAEELFLVFDEPVSSLALHLGYFEQNEWRGLPETGSWIAYDVKGNQLATGVLDAQRPSKTVFPNLPTSVKSFDIDREGVSVVKIFPTGYGSGGGAKIVGNNSDFNLHGLDYSTNTRKVSLRGNTTPSVRALNAIAKPVVAKPVTDVSTAVVVSSSSAAADADKGATSNQQNNDSQNTVDTPRQLAVHANLPLGGSFYGNYEYGFHTGNARIAGESSRRFRSEMSGNITAVRYNNRTLNDESIRLRCKSNQPNSVWCKCVNARLDARTCGYTLNNSYSVGNGGSIVIEVRNDNKGLPGSTILGRTKGIFVPLANKNDHYPILELERPTELVAGQTYHLVYKNLNPPVNCRFGSVSVQDAAGCPRNAGAISLNGVSFSDNASYDQVGIDPFRGKSAANFYRANIHKPWLMDDDNLSWYEVRYSDGTWVGDSYVAHNSTGDGQHEVSGNNRARQVFTVTDANRTVNGVWLNFGHSTNRLASGASLKATLKNKQGTVIATGNIKSSDACAQKAVKGNANGDRDAKHCRAWGYAKFNNAANLRVGSQYSLEFSANSGAGYLLSASFPLNYGAWNSESRNHWNDAHAEVSGDNGRNWRQWSEKHTDRDLSVLFTLQGGPQYLK